MARVRICILGKAVFRNSMAFVSSMRQQEELVGFFLHISNLGWTSILAINARTISELPNAWWSIATLPILIFISLLQITVLYSRATTSSVHELLLEVSGTVS